MPDTAAGVATRKAPGRTALPASASTSYSTLRVTVPVAGSTLSTPRQLAHPPVCGPPVGERAMFQSSTLRAQLRVAPSRRVSAFHARLPAYDGAHWPPEHSVNQMPLSGAASCTTLCALGLPA